MIYANNLCASQIYQLLNYASTCITWRSTGDYGSDPKHTELRTSKNIGQSLTKIDQSLANDEENDLFIGDDEDYRSIMGDDT